LDAIGVEEAELFANNAKSLAKLSLLFVKENFIA
jgi:hypothetical protein